MRRSVCAGLLLLAVLLSSPLHPQTTFSVNVKVVNVLATVRDKHGQIVRGLGKDDFTLEENGRRQDIRYFSQQTELPLTLGLLVDVSPSQRNLISEERSASLSFLDQLLREDKDHAFIIHFAREVELLQDLTASRARLERALGQLPMDSEAQASGWPGRFPRGGRGSGGGTSLYDAVYLASDEVLARQQGRKAIIILSDGVDTSSKLSLSSAVEAAQRADAIVYSILFYDEQAYQRGGGFGFPGGGGPWGRRGGGYPRFPQPANHPDGKKVLQQLSRETGGRFFEVSSKQPIGQIYALIQEELRNQYNLGYSSDRPATSREYRKIRLTARNNLVVQARDGYYAAP